MAHPYPASTPLSAGVYRAILLQALPYVVWSGLIGTAAGMLLGILASLASLDILFPPILTLYTIAGLLIGTAVGIRPVFRELMAFHWSADVQAR